MIANLAPACPKHHGSASAMALSAVREVSLLNSLPAGRPATGESAEKPCGEGDRRILAERMTLRILENSLFIGPEQGIWYREGLLSPACTPTPTHRSAGPSRRQFSPCPTTLSACAPVNQASADAPDWPRRSATRGPAGSRVPRSSARRRRRPPRRSGPRNRRSRPRHRPCRRRARNP